MTVYAERTKGCVLQALKLKHCHQLGLQDEPFTQTDFRYGSISTKLGYPG
jgi:hypothetical protein